MLPINHIPKILKWLPVALTTLLIAPLSQASFVLMEDFESFSATDALNSSANWSGGGGYTAETVAGTLAATTSNEPSALNLDISANQIAAGNTGTVFFQFRIDSSVPVAQSDDATTLDFNTGVAPGPVSGTSNTQGAYINLGANGADNRTLQGRDGSNQNNLKTGLNADSWYNIWLVLDNGDTTTSENEIYDIYLSEGRTNTLAPTSVANDFAFRDTPNGNPVDTIFLNKFRDAPGAYFDNYYVDSTAENLVNPVPEPGIYALLFGALSAAFVMIVRRREA